MNAQEIALHAIIKKNVTELLRPELIEYFNGPASKLYESCFMLKMRKVDISIETIKNYINLDNTIKGKDKEKINSYLFGVVSGNKYIDLAIIEDQLEEEHFQVKFDKIITTLRDSETTLQMKKDLIYRTADTIKRTKKTNDFQTVHSLIEAFRSSNKIGSASEWKSALIRLEDEYLKMIFDSIIYPQMYSILARPNDFKTTLLLNLLLEFDRLGLPGIHYTIEDSATMSAIKAISIKGGFNKKKIVQHDYNPDEFDKVAETFGKNIYVMDKMRTPDDVYMELHNKLSVGNYKWLSIDYIQLIKGEKFLSDYEKINNFDSLLFELSKEFCIPVIRLTQAPKNAVKSGTILGMGDEKGSGELSQNSRFSLSINPCGGGSDDRGQCFRIVERYKTTFCSKRQFKVEFDGPSGRIIDVMKLDQ